ITSDVILNSVGKDFDYVFHLATYHGNQSSITNPLADHENNTFTTLKICEHFKEVTALKKIVYSSAGCTVAQKTFDEANATTEDDTVSLYLDSPYQISKIIGEFYGNFYYAKYNLPFVKARFQNVYGPREVLGAGLWRGNPANTIWRNVIPSFIWRSLNNEELPLEKGGIATRDFIYVDDIVEGLIVCALKGLPGEVYNLASGEETSIRDLASTINDITGNLSRPLEIEARTWDRSGKRFGDTAKAKKELGFACKISLKEGLEITANWTKENFDKIKTCMLKHSYFFNDVEKYRNVSIKQ
ncbi:MAG: NAD-dependent epimerase/dehydratase family protein, partial [Alphaproteobacteria bacterium]|nr:NAD-dependent epimerase/dehydratase family protein [Alphaproteobacteria bacterium]NDE20020.1 NAD-dependent epimerase/dehydratase family protein [Alphaproteobacteria bacterium]